MERLYLQPSGPTHPERYGVQVLGRVGGISRPAAISGRLPTRQDERGLAIGHLLAGVSHDAQSASVIQNSKLKTQN